MEVVCFTVAVTPAFASSTAILTAIIPIAVPLLLSSHLSGAGPIAALAVSTRIVDTFPSRPTEHLSSATPAG
ncbi:hypothetical protein [Streptomyces sp. NPDC050416]|uniref:hypothetical protein n=1 Tax=Streptomyces sp. NPDC050416 TaxID=3365611 RepID=UPI0037AED75F